MKTFRYIISFLATILFLVSCTEFLEENPSKTTSVVPNTVEHLESLLNNYGNFASEPSFEIAFGSDDYGLNKDFYDAANSIYQVTHAQFATWDTEYLANYNRPYWPSEWKKIFTANLILENIGKVSGEESKKQQIKAEAHFVRLYSYFKLAEVYCLPYTDANKSEMGLPIKQSTSFEESMERRSLEETYDFMKSDLEKALELTRDFESFQGKKKIWRASSLAVKAFAARFYLALHDYEKAQSYAEDALSGYSFLRNYNTDMYFSDLPSEVTIFNPDPQNVELDYPYTHDLQTIPTDKFEWGESYYYRFLNNGFWAYWPSQELLGLYDHDYDLRYKYHIVENYSYDRGAINPPYSYPGYIFFFKSDILSGPSVPEMILIKAECQIRNGQWTDGLSSVNTLREMRMDANAPSSIINLNATSPEDALTKVLEERRREMPFISRWYDVRRYNNNDNPADDVVMSKTFYPFNASAILGNEAPITYKLEKNSRKFARPIPETDITASGDQLKQNEY